MTGCARPNGNCTQARKYRPASSPSSGRLTSTVSTPLRTASAPQRATAHVVRGIFVRVRDRKFVELWPVHESLPLLEGLGAVVRVKAEG